MPKINVNALEQFDQTGCTISQLHWIALNLANDYDDHLISECLPEIQVEDLCKIFKITKTTAQYGPFDYLDADEVAAFLINHNKYGFFAEIRKPECNGFTFDNEGKPQSWSVRRGVCSILYAYAETPELLMAEIQKISDDELMRFVNREKEKEAQS